MGKLILSHKYNIGKKECLLKFTWFVETSMIVNLLEMIHLETVAAMSVRLVFSLTLFLGCVCLMFRCLYF